MPKPNIATRQGPAPEKRDDRSRSNGLVPRQFRNSQRPSSGTEEISGAIHVTSPRSRVPSRATPAPIPAPRPTENPTEGPQPFDIPTEALQEQEQPTAASDTDDLQEIEAPAVPVKQEAPQNTSKMSDVTAEIGDQVTVVFRDDADQILRQRPWRDCSNVQKLFLQAVVGRLCKTSKEDTALCVTVQGLEEEIPIMKGDVDDFGVLCQAIAFAQNLKTDGDGEELVVDVKSL
jgi:hypothetical protein